VPTRGELGFLMLYPSAVRFRLGCHLASVPLAAQLGVRVRHEVVLIAVTQEES